MQNRSCFTRKQTCNGKYTKHCTRSRHQLKMAAPAEVSKRRSNFRIRQFKEKCHYNIAANLTFNTTVSFITLLIARTARIACADRHTHTHTHKTTTVTLSAHAHRGLKIYIIWELRLYSITLSCLFSEEHVIFEEWVWNDASTVQVMLSQI